MITQMLSKAAYKAAKRCDRNFIVPALYGAMLLCLFYNPLNQIGATSFRRVMGAALMAGMDVSKRVSHFYFYLFVLMPVCFFALFFLMSFLCGSPGSRPDEGTVFLKRVSGVALFPLIISYINLFSSGTDAVFNFAVIIPAFWVLATAVFLPLSRRFRNPLKFEVLKWSFFTALPFFFPAIVLFGRTSLYRNREDSLSLLMFLLYAMITVLIFVFAGLLNYRLKEKQWETVKKAFFPFALMPAALSVFLEAANILNQYHVYINSKVKWTVALYALAAIGAAAIFIVSRKKNRDASAGAFPFEKWYYPALLAGIALISVQVPMQISASTDLFESANAGVAVSGFFHFGKIPILETFDAHMLSNQVFSYLYGILNHDALGAVFAPYNGYYSVLILIMLYYLLRTFFAEDAAFLLCLLFPFTVYSYMTTFGIAFLVILAQIRAYRKPTVIRYLLYFLSFAAVFLFSLDIAAASIGASLLTWIVLLFYDKKALRVKKFLLCGVSVLLSALTAFFILCVLKGISPAERIREFLSLAFSNANWAFDTIGNKNALGFSVCYLFLPAVSLALFIAVLIRTKTEGYKNEPEKLFQLVVLSVLFWAYLINIQRSLVRHSLAENTVYLIIFTSVLFIALALPYLLGRRKLAVFTGSYFCVSLLFYLLISGANISQASLLNTAFAQFSGLTPYRTAYTRKVPRVVLSPDLEYHRETMTALFDCLLQPDETYVDFTNQTLLYALTGRENPVYVDQSPGLLSGESSQREFIRETEADGKAVLALLPADGMLKLGTDLDGIRNSYRYYLVSEYLSTRYEPLAVYGDYAVWCRKDRYEAIARKINEMKTPEKSVSVAFGPESLNGLGSSDAELSVENGRLLIHSGRSDPELTGIQNVIGLPDMPADTKSLTISIRYSASAAGSVQLYYTGAAGEEYSEAKSATQACAGSGVLEFTIPANRNSSIRLDPPSGGTFCMEGISTEAYGSAISASVRLSDSSYGKKEELHAYNLGDIPYLWAEYDPAGLSSKIRQQNLGRNLSLAANKSVVLRMDLSGLDKSAGNYLYISADAQTEGQISVRLENSSGGGNKDAASFQFHAKKGKNGYLVRVSSDFMWYYGNIDAVSVTSDTAISGAVVSILKGDVLN